MSEHAFWYTSRAAGIAAYVLLSVSVTWGLALSTGLLGRWARKPAIFEAHRLSSLFVLLLIAVHVVSLAGDEYIAWSPARLLVPFTSEYRPVAVAAGIVSMWVIALVAASFYLRRWIGYRAWRYLHYASFIGFLGAAAHGIFAGTDTAERWMQYVYLGSMAVVLLLVAYRGLKSSAAGAAVATRGENGGASRRETNIGATV